MQKIDTHVHCAPTKTAMPGAGPDQYIADPQEMRAHLESQGIGRAVLLSSGESAGLAGLSSNDACRQIAAAMPDFFSWMCNLDAAKPETMADRLKKYKAQGAVGLGELTINQWIDSPLLTAVFDAAQQLELPVTIHMSPRPGMSYGVCDRWGLPLLEQLLHTHPRLRVVGHSQVFWREISGDCPRDDQERMGYGSGPVAPGGRLVTLLESCPNLYADLAANSAGCAILRDEAFGLQFLERFQDRLFYATDTVNSRQVFPLGKFLDEAAADGRLSAQAYEKICRGNAQRIYGL